MADKLKQCPFCGGEAEYSMIDSSSVIPFGIINHFVTCKNHCLEGLYSRGNTKEEAIEAWNNRPSPWHTGTPTEEGRYLAVIGSPLDEPFYVIAMLRKEPNRMVWQGNIEPLAWEKIEPYKED